jgi:hypothetical protein
MTAICERSHAVPPVSPPPAVHFVSERHDGESEPQGSPRPVTHYLRPAPGLERFDVDSAWGQYVEQRGTVAPALLEEEGRTLTLTPWVPGRGSVGVQMELAW